MVSRVSLDSRFSLASLRLTITCSTARKQIRDYDGKQYVVIAAGGHSKITEEPLSDVLVAFALP